MAGSRARRLRLESPDFQPTPEPRETGTTGTSTTADSPSSTSASQPQQPPDRSKKRRLRKGGTAAEERSKEGIRARVDEWIRGGEVEETDQAKKNGDVIEEEVEDDAEEEDEVVSSAPSSPLRAPVKPDELKRVRNPAYEEAFKRVEARYKEKTARQMKLPTLDQYKPRSLYGKDLKPPSIPESERKTVLSAAKFVVGVASSVGDGEPQRRASGLWIDWDKDNKTGIVLTTADLIFRNHPSSILKKVYVPDAEVIVHMRDDTTAEAQLLYYQQHYNLALFRVTMDQHVHVPYFDGEVQCGQEIFVLGRDEHSYLRIGRGRVKYSDRGYFDGYHYMNILGGHEDFEYSKGMTVIDFDGNVVGMIIKAGYFMLSSILLKCLHIWRKFRYQALNTTRYHGVLGIRQFVALKFPARTHEQKRHETKFLRRVKLCVFSGVFLLFRRNNKLCEINTLHDPLHHRHPTDKIVQRNPTMPLTLNYRHTIRSYLF